MEIKWYGHSCFRLSQRGLATVVTDPYDHQEIGYNELKLKADIVTISHEAAGHSNINAIKGARWEITGPGEYEIGGVFISAVRTGDGNKGNNHNNVFVFDYDGVTIAHLGDIKQIPSRKEIDAFGTVDVLLVPVGGGESLTAAKASEVISLIEPGIVIPMHYSMPECKLKLSNLHDFLKQMGVGNNLETVDSLKITANSVPEDIKIVILEYQQ